MVLLLASIASAAACGASTVGKKCSSDAVCTGTFEKCSKSSGVCRQVCTDTKPGSCPDGFECIGSAPFQNGLCEPKMLSPQPDLLGTSNDACINALVHYLKSEAPFQNDLRDKLSTADRKLYDDALRCGLDVCTAGNHFECNRKMGSTEFSDWALCLQCFQSQQAHSICFDYLACLPFP
jgi:hypothetical protein